MQATSKREAVSYNFHSLADIEQETDLELRIFPPWKDRRHGWEPNPQRWYQRTTISGRGTYTLKRLTK